MKTASSNPDGSPRPIFRFFRFWHDRLSLEADRDDEQEIIESISRNVVFRGVNLWTLVFAIFVASIGLNVNSTAVIIGAMLIAPLMGPIIGIGLGVAILAFQLIQKAAYNLGIAVLASVLTSSLYFALTPLSGTSSELLARTTPTIWDVLIAFFGGMAGIVAGASKDKGNAIPGVAIATALMPPLCTAGFGLANGNVHYFIGAFYLFFINSVMISLSTFLVVRLLGFQRKNFVDARTERLMRRWVWIVVTITVLPSIYLGYRIVRETIFNHNVRTFIESEMNWDDTQVITEKHAFAHHDTSFVKILLAGKQVQEVELARIAQKLPDYGLSKTRLTIRQGAYTDAQHDKPLKESLFERDHAILDQQQAQIRFLEKQLEKHRQSQLPVDHVALELKAMYPNILGVHLSHAPGFQPDSNLHDTIGVAIIQTKGTLARKDQERIVSWLKARTGLEAVKLFVW